MNRRANLIAIGVFIAALVGVFILSPRNRQRLQSGFLGIVSPFLKKGSEVDSRWKAYQKGLKKIDELEGENQRLKVDNDKFKAENEALRGFEAESLRLKAALGYRDSSPFTLIPARVIGRSPSNWWSTVVIDKGSGDGIDVDKASAIRSVRSLLRDAGAGWSGGKVCLRGNVPRELRVPAVRAGMRSPACGVAHSVAPRNDRPECPPKITPVIAG